VLPVYKHTFGFVSTPRPQKFAQQPEQSGRAEWLSPPVHHGSGLTLTPCVNAAAWNYGSVGIP